MMRSWQLPVPTGAALTVMLISSTLGGCGQTGNLYLPDKDGEVVSTAAGAEVSGDTTESTAEAERKRTEQQRQPAPQ
jgi:predicted small lipoprotein YifL